MYTSTLALGLLAWTATTAIAAPREQIIEERHIVVEKRQADVGQLLQLASLAGITALPTDPAVLLSLGPLANSLAAALPTPSVLSVLVTAAPSTFVSAIINDPSYANSFESAFSDGSSPSWFTALPTDVRSYLHTYSGFGQLAGAAGGIKQEVSATGGSQSTTTTTTAASTGSGSSATKTSSGATSAAAAASSSSPSPSSAASASAGGAAGSSSSHAGAAGPTGALAAGIVGVVGILGAAVVL